VFDDVQAVPWWCLTHIPAWGKMVDKWLADEWEETHNELRRRRLMMSGASHHQGNHNLQAFANTWVREFNF